MLLAVDIGNTNIHNGVFRDGDIVFNFRVPTYKGDIKSIYKRRLKRYLERIDNVIIVSVVPERLALIKKLIRSFGKKAIVVGEDIDSGVINLYKRPEQVGQDRLVNARAAYEFYGGESIIVDFGTAITIDVVNRHREYLGGVIAPGVDLSLDALSKKAALLPYVKLRKPRNLLGKETTQSMISGVVYGFSSLCDGIVESIKRRYCKDAKVIATGGRADLIAPYCRMVEKIDLYLTLKGLHIIWRQDV